MSRSAATSKSKGLVAPAVLLVDDNPDDQFFFQLAWQKARLTNPICVAGTCKEAMDYIDGVGRFSDRAAYPCPGIVLLDMRLPDGNGCDLVRWIRSHPRLSRLIIIVLSGSAQQTEVDLAYREGANSFLLKTSNPRDLEKTVNLIQACWLSQTSQINQAPSRPEV